jgi:4-amino-4-deoxy-L-arabinose transferase-like glycosyltransferase
VRLPSGSSSLTGLAGLLVVAALFCAPLFIGLDGWDLRSDEAGHSFAVNRIIETGEWLTPRSIPVDGPFLEKPPLKFWMIAGAIRAGLVPHNETGFRLLDVLMGAIAFIYIYWIGVRISGAVCGLVAVLMTFSIDPIVFEHGIRSNNMEAPLLLAYCGGIYHFMQWVEGRRPVLHALAFSLYFVLGFMTKFVAVLFLPLVCVLTVAVVPVARTRFVARWRDWIAPVLLSVALIAPWFVYESIVHKQQFWETILGVHVYTRFTSSLDPAHLHPWDYYFTETWRQLVFGGARLVAIPAIIAMVVRAWIGRPWQMRLLLAWWLVPFALISMGTSKLFHYAYPFLPPIALAIGWLSGAVIALASGPRAAIAVRRLERWRLPGGSQGALRAALIGLTVIAMALAIATAVGGPVVWSVDGIRIFQNSSIVRPLVIGGLLLTAAGLSSLSVQVLAAVALVLVLPVSMYTVKVSRVTTIDNRFRVIRDCAAAVRQANPAAPAGVLNAARGYTHHSYYYYLYRLGPWEEPETVTAEEIRSRFFHPDKQTLILMRVKDYEWWRQQLDGESMQAAPTAHIVYDIAVVTPGPYRPCGTLTHAVR